jgi:hypothetical protein
MSTHSDSRSYSKQLAIRLCPASETDGGNTYPTSAPPKSTALSTGTKIGVGICTPLAAVLINSTMFPLGMSVEKSQRDLSTLKLAAMQARLKLKVICLQLNMRMHEIEWQAYYLSRGCH